MRPPMDEGDVGPMAMDAPSTDCKPNNSHCLTAPGHRPCPTCPKRPQPNAEPKTARWFSSGSNHGACGQWKFWNCNTSVVLPVQELTDFGVTHIRFCEYFYVFFLLFIIFLPTLNTRSCGSNMSYSGVFLNFKLFQILSETFLDDRDW